MKTYHFRATTKGKPLEAVIIVAATRIDQAMKLAIAWAQGNSVDIRTLELLETKKIDKSMVVYGYDGDY